LLMAYNVYKTIRGARVTAVATVGG
jgi:hypothetical protein